MLSEKWLGKHILLMKADEPGADKEPEKDKKPDGLVTSTLYKGWELIKSGAGKIKQLATDHVWPHVQPWAEKADEKIWTPFKDKVLSPIDDKAWTPFKEKIWHPFKESCLKPAGHAIQEAASEKKRYRVASHTFHAVAAISLVGAMTLGVGAATMVGIVMYNGAWISALAFGCIGIGGVGICVMGAMGAASASEHFDEMHVEALKPPKAKERVKSKDGLEQIMEQLQQKVQVPNEVEGDEKGQHVKRAQKKDKDERNVDVQNSK